MDKFYTFKNKNKIGVRKECKTCYKQNRDNLKAKRANKKSCAKWYKNNATRSKAITTKRHKIRIKQDIEYKIRCNLRTRLWHALKNNQKVGSAVNDAGCTIKELKQYLETKFYPHPKTIESMSWDNWKIDGWHIDHIVPLASFDLTDRKQFLKACHYTNLQPLWAFENFIKGDNT